MSLDDVLESHAAQIANYGGTDGIRDSGLLQSAMAQPEATFGGQFLHTDLFEMAAAYLFHIVQDHPFMDGNKRVGLEAALLFLEINGHSIDATDGACNFFCVSPAGNVSCCWLGVGGPRRGWRSG